MHIPDGVINPVTCTAFYGLMAPFWIISAKKSAKKLDKKFIPVMIAGVLLSLAIMSTDVKLPGGSSGHAIGATLLSAIFGPWVGTFTVSITLAIQAYMFHDGGITTLGANCVSMALIPSFVTALIMGLNKSSNVAKNTIFAGISGYTGLVAAALITGLILKSQNATISVTDTVIEHLLYFGWLEAGITTGLYMVLKSERSPLYNLTCQETVNIKE